MKFLNNKNSFLKSIKFEEDPDKAMLLKIQNDLEKMVLMQKMHII